MCITRYTIISNRRQHSPPPPSPILTSVRWKRDRERGRSISRFFSVGACVCCANFRYVLNSCECVCLSVTNNLSKTNLLIVCAFLFLFISRYISARKPLFELISCQRDLALVCTHFFAIRFTIIRTLFDRVSMIRESERSFWEWGREREVVLASAIEMGVDDCSVDSRTNANQK